MAVVLNKQALAYAERLIREKKTVFDTHNMWSKDQPSTEQEDTFIRQHGFLEYEKWHLGIDKDKSEDTKGRYTFPYGDFSKVHRCAVISAESRAGQYKYADIEQAASHLLSMIDALKPLT